MACAGCGRKRSKQLVDAPIYDAKGKLVSNSFREWSKKSPSRKAAGSKTPPTREEIVNSALKNISHATRGTERVNILTQSSSERAVWIIGHFQRCAVCRYIQKIVDKAASGCRPSVAFYTVEKNDVQPNGFTFDNNPVVVFIDHGKPVHQVSGLNTNLPLLVQQFYEKKPLQEPTPSKEAQSRRVVYKLKPNPTHVEAYDKLLKTLQKEHKSVKNLSTFLDPKTNILVVTAHIEG